MAATTTHVVVRRATRRDRSARLIVATHGPSMGLVLRAERLGVRDLLSLPLRRDEFLRAVRRMQSAAPRWRSVAGGRASRVGNYALVGRSPAMLEVYKLMARVGPSAATVLIQGESGTAKSRGPGDSPRWSQKRRAGSSPSTAPRSPRIVGERALWHEKGAFTGAVTRKIGRFEQAVGAPSSRRSGRHEPRAPGEDSARRAGAGNRAGGGGRRFPWMCVSSRPRTATCGKPSVRGSSARISTIVWRWCPSAYPR